MRNRSKLERRRASKAKIIDRLFVGVVVRSQIEAGPLGAFEEGRSSNLGRQVGSLGRKVGSLGRQVGRLGRPDGHLGCQVGRLERQVGGLGRRSWPS